MSVPEKRSRKSYYSILALTAIVPLTYLFLLQFQKLPKNTSDPNALINGPLEPPGFPLGKNGRSSVAPPSSAPPSFQLIDEEILTRVQFEAETFNSDDKRDKISTTSSNPDLLDYLSKNYPRPPAQGPLKDDANCHKEFPSIEINVESQVVVSQSNEPMSGVSGKIFNQENTANFERTVSDLAFIRGRVLEPLSVFLSFASQNFVKFYKSLVEGRSTWFWTMVCALAVMLTGIIPALLIPGQWTNKNCCQASTPSITPIQLNRLLCFAVGSLLGDVFFHLLPESWNGNSTTGNCYVGTWVIAGLLICLIIEKFCSQSESNQYYFAALANLVANIMDNFTHGLAVGGSFLVSNRLGFLTTFAILLHEIPHEISDFAILLRADFDRRSAIKAQLITAFGGIMGAVVALMNDQSSSVNADQRPSWILPFTAGGFLNIALIQILPDLLRERNSRENIKHLLLISTGICIMGLLNVSVHV